MYLHYKLSANDAWRRLEDKHGTAYVFENVDQRWAAKVVIEALLPVREVEFQPVGTLHASRT